MKRLGEEFFEALFERQGDAVIVADDDTRIIRVNEAACAMLGRSREELVDLRVPDIVVEEVPDDARMLWDRFRSDSQQRGRISLRRGDGTVVLADYVATATVADGLHVSVLRDDTERRNAELVLQLLTETSAALETTFDPVEIVERVVRSAIDLVADWAVGDLYRPDGTLERVAIAHRDPALESKAWALWRRRGATHPAAVERALRSGAPLELEVDDELIDDSFTEPELRERARDLHIRRALVVPIQSRRSGQPHGMLYLAQAESDRLMLRGLRKGADELARRVGAALDRAQAYEELREAYEASEAQRRILDAIMTNVPEGITIAEGPDVRVRMVSRFGLESLGLDPDEALGSTSDEHPGIFRVVDADGEPPPPDQLPLSRAIRTGKPVLDEHLTVDRHDGYRAELLINAAPIHDAEGRVTGGVLAWRDVTELMDIERKLDEALRREREARRAAEDASRSKDQFLGTVSHELRTPLNAVLGWVQLLRSDRPSPSELDHGLAVIERNATAQKQLIDDLLDVSRIVSGRIRLDLEKVQLESVLNTVVTSAEPTASSREIEVRCEVEDTLPAVSGDASRLQQVLSNLVSNAIKFSPDGKQVMVTLGRDGPDHVRLTVEDEGVGIEPELLPVIFDRFRQAEGGSTRRHGGLGLGLAISRELVHLHGGTIEAHSEGPGRGSTFVVRLPLQPVGRDATASVPPTPETSLAPEPPQLADLRGTRVLLVEDDPDSRALMAHVLGRAGAEVSVASSAARALELLARRPPDVLISDIGMPSMDGYELMRRVRQMEPSRQPPAIAVTAYASEADRRRALDAGYQIHLGKPVEAAELAVAVDALRRKRG